MSQTAPAAKIFPTDTECCRYGSKLVHDGEIGLYQFMVSFMGVYFSGQAAGQLFSFSSSKF